MQCGLPSYIKRDLFFLLPSFEERFSFIFCLFVCFALCACCWDRRAAGWLLASPLSWRRGAAMAPGRKLPHLLILCFYLQHFFLWLRPNFSSNEEKKIYCLSFLLMVESDFGVLPHVLTLYRREETGKHRLLKGGKAWKEVPITNTCVKDLFLPWSQDLVRKMERSIYNEEEEKQHQLDRGRAEKYL